MREYSYTVGRTTILGKSYNLVKNYIVYPMAENHLKNANSVFTKDEKRAAKLSYKANR